MKQDEGPSADQGLSESWFMVAILFRGVILEKGISSSGGNIVKDLLFLALEPICIRPSLGT